MFILGQIEKHRRKLDDLFDAEELLEIERDHNKKLQAEFEVNIRYKLDPLHLIV